MRKFFLILAAASGAALAQTPPPPPEYSVPMVPAVRPPLGAASRAARHELLARERQQRIEEKAEDLSEARKKRRAERRMLQLQR